MGQVMSGGIWAVVVAVSLRPPFRRGRLGYACFVLSMAVNEIPLLFVAVVGISIVLPMVGELPDSTARAGSASTSPVVHAVLPGAQHGFDFFASVRARVAANAIEDFLDGVRPQPVAD